MKNVTSAMNEERVKSESGRLHESRKRTEGENTKFNSGRW